MRLRLRDSKKFQDDAKKSGKAIGSIDENAKKSNKKMSVFAGGMKKAGPPMLLAGAAAVGFGVKSVQAFNESRKVAAQTGAVLKSTGGAAGVSAKQVEGLAGSISEKTGIDDEAIQSGQNLLLTFTNVQNKAGKGNDVFNQTTKTMTDMSAALGQDTKTSAIQLGKALNDPVKGVGALSKVGVSFTEQQKKQIKTLTKGGDTMGAQKIILKELNKEFGGSAEAQATAGAKLSNTFGNLQETIGGKLAPVVDKVAGGLNKFIGGMSKGTGAGGKFARIIKTTIGGALNFVKRFLNNNRVEIAKLGQAFRNIAKAAQWAFQNVILPVVKRVWPGIQNTITNALRVIGGVIKLFSAIFRGNFGDMWKAVKQIFSAGKDQVLNVIKTLGPLLVDALKAIGGLAVKGLKAALSGIGGILKRILVAAINAAIDLLNKGVDLINAATPGEVKVLGKVIIPAIPDIPHAGHVSAQSGGLVPGRGRGDRVPAMLEPREYVVRRRAVEALGPSFMAAINEGRVPAGAGAGGAGQDIVVRSNLIVDGRVLADSVSRHTANKNARR